MVGIDWEKLMQSDKGDKSNNIVVLAGFSGAGKDTFADILHKEYDYHFVTSHTSRPMREGESELNPYYFVSRNKFENLIETNQMIEYRTYDTLVEGVPDTWYYGVSKKSIEPYKPYVCVVDMLGLEALIEEFGDRVIGIFLHVPHDLREERAKERGSFDKTEWDRRLEDDIKVFSEERINASCQHRIVNINKEDTLKELLTILEKVD